MELYIIRHGEPNYKYDTITPYGWEEAELLGPRIAALHPDRIYASSCTRAQDTARPSCRLLGMEYEIQPWMQESMGYMQRVPLNDVSHADSGYVVTFGGGASPLHDFAPHRSLEVSQMIRNSDAFLEQLGYRREGALYRAVRPNRDKICCFCHGGFGSAWFSHLLGMYPIWNNLQFGIMTTSVTLFRFEANETGYCIPSLGRMGDCTHLRDIRPREQVPDYSPVWREEGTALREKFVDTFADKKKKGFRKAFAVTGSDIFGDRYDGTLLDFLQNKREIELKQAISLLKKRESVYITWDFHDVHKDDSRFAARRPKNVPIRMTGGTLAKLLREEKGENVAGRYLPKGLYVFDDSFSWCISRSEEMKLYLVAGE